MQDKLQRIVLVSLCVLYGAVCGAQGLFSKDKEAPVYTQPAENLLLIIADIQRHIRDDVYRFPYPLDVNGQNVFRVSIVRLSNYEKLYPGKMTDVVAVAKAQAFERLCAFQEAGANYQAGEKSKDSQLRKLAQEGFARTKKFSGVIDQPIDQSALRSYERDMKAKVSDLHKLANELAGSSHQCLALLERERAQLQLAEFYTTMRFMQPYTTEGALDQIKKNLEANTESKLRYVHNLMRADLHLELAKEYTILNDPEGPNFSLKAFEDFINSARSEYSVVEQADGFAEKQEGRAKLAVLDAFVERIRDRAR